MKGPYRDLLKHSSIYGLGQILSRVASFLLLPLYTRHLLPADYGCIAILDLTSSLLGILIGSGLAAAISRHHFEASDPAGQDRVWWSGLTFVAMTATAIVVPTWLARESLARWLLGPGLARGPFYFALSLPTLWLNSVYGIPETHLAVRKRSLLAVVLGLVRLLTNVTLNVVFLAVLDLGVAGILCGNLVTAAALLAAQLVIFRRDRGPFAFDPAMIAKLWRFGWPLVVTSLLTVLMQQSDRYLLRHFVGIDEVGIFSLAVAFAQAINTMCFDPFNRIWNVTLYEVAERPEAGRIYAEVFRYTVCAALLIVLGVVLFARPVIQLMAAPSYAGAAGLVPIVCLAGLLLQVAYLFHGPIRLAKRTARLIPAIAIGVATSLAANLVLIPRFGATGAAWSAVLSMAVYMAICLKLSQEVIAIDYPLGRCGLVGLGMLGAYEVVRLADGLDMPPWGRLAVAALVWSAAAWLVAWPTLLKLVRLVRGPVEGPKEPLGLTPNAAELVRADA